MPSRVIVLSGGSRGLGQAMAAHFLEQGDIVCTFSRSRTDFVTKVLEAPENEDRCLFDVVDAVNADAVHDFVRRVTDRFGRVDAVINNAGIARDGLLATAAIDVIDQVIDINLRGTLYLTRACLRPMLLARFGRVINISSIIGLRGYRGLAAYSATKAAMDAATRALAREVGQRGITVNSIAPGYLETEMTRGMDPDQLRQIIRRTPLGRLGRPADILPAVDFLLSPGAGFITGHVLVIDGGIIA